MSRAIRQPARYFRRVCLAAIAAAIGSATAATLRAAEAAPSLAEAAKVRGGLMVVVGVSGVEHATAAVGRGTVLAQVLDHDAKAVDWLRQSLDARGLYGLVSADVLPADGRLPYCENLVNFVVLAQPRAGQTLLAEAARVLCPHGVLAVPSEAAADDAIRGAGLEPLPAALAASSAAWRLARKPWPAAMDSWSHPRHGPDGNTVSQDRLVGPPRRVRWVAGPPQEISNMVAAGGRNFYGGVLARDSFNGLRLWQRTLTPSPARGGFSFRSEPGGVAPVADGDRLYVVVSNRLEALDAATGQKLRDYPEAGAPKEIVLVDGAILSITADAVRALDAATGTLRWQAAAVEPRCLVAGDGAAHWVSGKTTPGAACEAVSVDLIYGNARWRRSFDWLGKVRGCVYHAGLLAYEISTLNDDGPGNVLQAVASADGNPLWRHAFVPGMAHMKQARAMFAANLLWILDQQKCVALDPKSGAVRRTHGAGSGHCFPPVATEKFLFAGEMNLTELDSGAIDANRITKGACSRDAGFVPANGLIYAAPKHCVCWPMLRDYTALAPGLAASEASDSLSASLDASSFVLERGVAVALGPPDAQTDWPMYRHDGWRSGAAKARVPARLKTHWTADLGGWPTGAIADDWRHNSFARGPVTPPVASGNLVIVAKTDAHQVVALDANSGKRRWTFTANGRIDTPPTLHRGLCLFGTRSGWVYCLRAADGQVAWRLRAAPHEQRICAYGQVESPWPVSGSVVVIDGVAFFAAGRQPLADGGILVFAAEPASGRIVWVKRLADVPQKDFYAGAGMDFKAFDLLHQEGPAVALSRWLFDRRTGAMTCEAHSGFAHLVTGGAGVMVPRGFWSYGPRYESEQDGQRPFFEPLVVFCDSTLWGGSQERRSMYRRGFPGAGEKFDAEWFAKWKILSEGRKGGDIWRSQRLARGAAWSRGTSGWFDADAPLVAMALADDTLFVAGQRGGLAAISPQDGTVLARAETPPPVWDGLAALPGRLILTGVQGKVVCLGE